MTSFSKAIQSGILQTVNTGKGCEKRRKVHGRLNASWKISSLAVNGQSFLVIDGYLLNPIDCPRNDHVGPGL
jgi:hypothetical protein